MIEPAIGFGQRIRQRRLEKEITLRDFARLLRVTPTYVSQIEQDYCKPPASDVVERMARILGEDREPLLVHAGRLPDELLEVIRARPEAMPRLIRALGHPTSRQAEVVADFAEQLSQQTRCQQETPAACGAGT